MKKTVKVTIWNEYPHGQSDKAHKEAYPDGLHNTIKSFLAKDAGLEVRCSLYDDPGFGLDDEILNNTDVLIWWAHVLHAQIPDELVARIKRRVLSGMGIIFLHSAHYSKVMSAILGTSGRLNWREANEKQRLWKTCPLHPIAEGVPDTFVLDAEEMYGEYFDIPQPEDIVFMGWFEGGNVLRSGVTFRRGAGKVFYFQPGHETHKTYFNENIQKVITNAVHWAAPVKYYENLDAYHEAVPYEKINKGESK